MYSFISKREVITLAILSVFLVGAIFFAHTSGNKQEKNPFAGWQTREYEKERLIWEKRIEDVGGKEAYAQFKQDIRTMDYSAQHALAHIFGQLVYEKEDLNGIAVCDGSFGFGCYHSFFGVAIQENGMNVIEDLDKACIDAYGPRGTGCSHGIGHGVLSALGEDELMQALHLCSGLSWKGPFGGCTSGVFMEYNFRTMAAFSEGAFQRPLVLEEKYKPCTYVGESYEQSCYFEQPAWWRGSLEQDGKAPKLTYQEMGEWCAALEEEKQRLACFRGIGNVIPANAGYDVELSVERCDLMPNKEGESMCRQGAAWGFFADSAFRTQAVYMCSLGASVEEKEECELSYLII